MDKLRYEDQINMAYLDDNSNQATDVMTDVTFVMFYDEETESLNIHTIKVHNLPIDVVQGAGASIFIRFNVKDWDCKTQIKTARTRDLIWNEDFCHKIKSKCKAHLQLYVTVEEDSGKNIGQATLTLEELNITEKTVYILPIASQLKSKLHKGHLRFSVHPSEKAVKVKVIKAQNLTRVMREYMVRARLQLSEDLEQRTSLQKSPCWNEEITFKGKDTQNGTLILQVVGERTDERQVLGETRLHLSDVRQREYGRYLPLQEPKVDTISFSTNFTSQSEQSGTLVFTILGLENLRKTNFVEKIGVYVQIKQMCDGQIVKKEKTPRSQLSQNVIFKRLPLSFNINTRQRKATTFVLSIKTQQNSYSIEKPVIGTAVIGPLSEGKWYKDLLRVKNKEVQHSLNLKMT